MIIEWVDEMKTISYDFHDYIFGGDVIVDIEYDEKEIEVVQSKRLFMGVDILYIEKGNA